MSSQFDVSGQQLDQDHDEWTGDKEKALLMILQGHFPNSLETPSEQSRTLALNVEYGHGVLALVVFSGLVQLKEWDRCEALEVLFLLS